MTPRSAVAVLGVVLSLALGVLPLAGQNPNPPVMVSVDTQANRHPISPLIYGVNLFDTGDPNIITTTLSDLNSPLNRYGGNRASTYNWNLNSDNRGNDYFFESISDASQTAGERGDTIITRTKAAGAEPMITLPMLAWIAKAGVNHPFPCSFPTERFANQQKYDPFDAHCGNGVMPDGLTLIQGAMPSDAFVANSLATQQAWVQHIVGAFPPANGGLKYYILDNEHDLWAETHRDVVPNNLHYNTERDLLFSYAAMIKAQDPTALVVGPEPSGWLGYELSPADFEYGVSINFAQPINTFPDRMAIGGEDYMPWLLGQFASYEAQNGGRILDVFTVHYYPQGGMNNSNTRSLWDPNFVDPSFINDKIMLIPRMKQWVAQNYPGTKIGITEYNWGTISNEDQTDNMGYAVTQADVLGIFGREGLDLATRFNAPVPGKPTYNAMKMFRNYDGFKNTFGDMSIGAATAADPDNVAVFAAQRSSDGALTIMLLSKYAANSTPATVNLANFAASGPVEIWRLSGTGAAIQQLASAAVANNAVNLSLPAQSITLLVISQAAGDFDITPPTPSAVLVGQGGTSLPIQFQATASGAFGGMVTFSCTGLPMGASCNFAPPTATPTANAPVSISLTVDAGAAAIGSSTVQISASSMGAPAAKTRPFTLQIGAAAAATDLSVSAAVSLDAALNSSAYPLTFTITVTNQGMGSSVPAMLVVDMPGAVRVGALPGGCSPSGASSVVCTFTSDNAAPSQFPIPVYAPFPHVVHAAATVSSTAPDINMMNNSAPANARTPPRPFFLNPATRFP